MDAFYGMDQINNTYLNSLRSTADFKERIAYDANGNIQKYLRNNFGETGLPMDSLQYGYQTNTDKLLQIKDSAADFVGGNYDLHSQPLNNYAYDSIGNLIKDSIEHIHGIQWNVYGKITEIDHDSTTIAKPIKNIYYYYDAAGNRIGKKTTRRDSIAASYTWYVRDASGNVMATYTASEDTTQALSAADLHIGEKHIYGSSRLGIINANYSTDATTDGLGTYTSPWTGLNLPSYTGKKQYELTNHLGNVLATISDKKIGVSLTTDSSLIDHYEADVQIAQDYYPFGMIMPGRMFTALTVPGGSVTGTTQVNGYTVPVDLALSSRSGNEPTQYVASRTIDLTEGFESADNDDVTAYLTDTSYAGSGNGGSTADGVAGASKYRFGFNGKENDNEVKGIGDQIDYGMRVYDPRAGRFLSVDPSSKSFPWNSTYAYAENDVIRSTDLDGLEKSVSTISFSVSKGRTLMRHTSDNYVQPEGTFHIGFKPQTPKEIIAHALVTCLKAPQLPDNGNFVFVEFADHPERNTAFYTYKDADGSNDTHFFPHDDIAWMNGQLGIAQENLSKGVQVTGAIMNLVAAGTLAKAELKGLSAETKAGTTQPSAAIDIYKGKFAQPNHSNNFSPAGQEILGVKTIDQASANLKSGTWSASKLPIDYVVRDGQVYYLNTRSIAALTEAGVPKEKWVFQNQTGVKQFEDNLTNNLNGSTGYDQVTNRQTGKKTKL